jgi:hypothetical protein
VRRTDRGPRRARRFVVEAWRLLLGFEKVTY